MSRSLIVLPDDSARPILNAIHGASKSIRVKMFVFSDPELLKSVIAAHDRGATAVGDSYIERRVRGAAPWVG